MVSGIPNMFIMWNLINSKMVTLIILPTRTASTHFER